MSMKRRSWSACLVFAGVALMSVAADKAPSVLNHTVKDDRRQTRHPHGVSR